jgi:hypothetical protein
VKWWLVEVFDFRAYPGSQIDGNPKNGLVHLWFSRTPGDYTTRQVCLRLWPNEDRCDTNVDPTGNSGEYRPLTAAEQQAVWAALAFYEATGGIEGFPPQEFDL